VHKHTHKVLQLFHFVYAKVSRILPSAASGHKSLSNLLDLLLVVGGGPNIPPFAQGAKQECSYAIRALHFASLGSMVPRWFRLWLTYVKYSPGKTPTCRTRCHEPPPTPMISIQTTSIRIFSLLSCKDHLKSEVKREKTCSTCINKWPQTRRETVQTGRKGLGYPTALDFRHGTHLQKTTSFSYKNKLRCR